MPSELPKMTHLLLFQHITLSVNSCCNFNAAGANR
jgi:hypothetical protein